MTKVGCAALLAVVMGIATEAAAVGNNTGLAGKRGQALRFPNAGNPHGLSPIVTEQETVASPIVPDEQI